MFVSLSDYQYEYLSVYQLDFISNPPHYEHERLRVIAEGEFIFFLNRKSSKIFLYSHGSKENISGKTKCHIF